ncbi:uncharacterized protein SETTUDRAFT_26662, partial [Exserohilum turcica Et28A]
MSSPSQNQNALLLLVQQLQQELQNQRSEITSLRDSVAQLQLQLQSRQHPNDAQTRVRRLSFEAKASSWPDISRVTTLHRGLRQSLRQKLEELNDSLFSLPYDQYVETMQSAERRSK